MEISIMKEGMKVRISQSLKISEKRWGLVGGMLEMRGDVCTVEKLDSTAAYIRNKDGRAYWFAPEDLLPATMPKRPSPVMFDPKNIEVL